MVIIHFCPHDGGVMYEWHWPHYLSELKNMGYRIIDCNPNKILKRKGSPQDNANILETISLKAKKKYGQVLLFAAQGRDDNLDPGIFYVLRKHNIPSVNICVDGWIEITRLKKIGKYFDLNWVTHYNALTISKIGCKTVYMPMAANPYFFRPTSSERELAIAFVGSKYGARSTYIRELGAAGIRIKVRGSGWRNQKGAYGFSINRRNIDIKAIMNYFFYEEGRKIIFSGALSKARAFLMRNYKDYLTDTIEFGPELSFKDMISFYSMNLLSLGITELNNTYILKSPLYQYRLRDFECPMIGCAHLVRKTRELEESFLDGKEIIFYDSIEECIEKAKYYLSESHIEETKKIGHRARERSLAYHTWANRFIKLFNILGLKPK